MLANMSAYLRSQSSNELTPHPRSVKSWLKSLPLADVGETTRQFYLGLKNINQQSAIPSDRLKAMDATHPVATMIIARLRKHFVNRSLPLPPKSQGVVEFHDTLLTELSAGFYKAIEGALNENKSSLNSSGMASGIYWGMYYLSLLLQNSARLYRPSPIGIWQKMNQMFAIAEENDLLLAPISLEHTKNGATNILSLYMQVSMLVLANPLSLRSGEAELLIRFLEDNAKDVVLSTVVTPDAQGGVYLFDLSEDRAPFYSNAREEKLTLSTRSFKPDKLIEALRVRAEQVGSSAHGFNVDFSERVINSWTTRAKRRFSRFDRNETVEVVVGLEAIHAALMELRTPITEDENIELADPNEADDNEQVLSLEEGAAAGDKHFAAINEKKVPLPKDELELTVEGADEKVNPDEDMSEYYMKFVTGTVPSQEADKWDAVFAGKIGDMALGGAAGVEAACVQKPLSFKRFTQKPEMEKWHVLDVSVGGFRLLWHESYASHAQVGQLIGLKQLQENESDISLSIGVARWIVFAEDSKLELGTQVLSSTAEAVLVQKTLRDGETGYGDKFPALMLPALEVASLPASLVLPVRKFKPGDDILIIKETGLLYAYIKEEYRRHASTSQFCYSVTDQPEKLEEVPVAHEETEDNRFANVWKSI